MVAIIDKPQKKVATPKKISWKAFQEKYLSREDEYKYEWVDGCVEKTLRTIDKTQFYIQQNLAKFFILCYSNKT
ncbi:MAG: hypothetical protein AAF960_29000 [Bacteroidota bacterium]